jgi:hypothetical protein
MTAAAMPTGSGGGDEPAKAGTTTGGNNAEDSASGGGAPVNNITGGQQQQQLGVGGNGPPLPSALMAAINGGHDLFVHIHPGDSISLAVGNEIQTIQGE